jgi:H2-forming N5,N10-methylenetetrahydromethanopterin dehydrogenase-like enzyme
VAATHARLSLLVTPFGREEVVVRDLADGFDEGGWQGECEQIERALLDVL